MDLNVWIRKDTSKIILVLIWGNKAVGKGQTIFDKKLKPISIYKWDKTKRKNWVKLGKF